MEQRIVVRHLSGSKTNQVEEFPVKLIKEVTFGREVSCEVKCDPDRDDLVSRQHLKIAPDAAITGRYLGLHDNASAAVSIVDKTGRVVLWSNEAGDRSLFWGVVKRGGQRKVADRLVHKLKDALTK
jgi:hypothetical protein